MTADGLALELPAEALEAIAARAAELVEDRRREETEPLMTVDEAARYIACKRQRIYDLTNQGRLRHCREGRRLLFRREWLDECLEEATVA